MTRFDLAESWVLVKHVCCDVLSKIAVRKSINVMRISSLFFFSKQWQDKKLSRDSRLNSGTSSQTLRFLKIDRLNHILQLLLKMRCTGSFCLNFDKGTIYIWCHPFLAGLLCIYLLREQDRLTILKVFTTLIVFFMY